MQIYAITMTILFAVASIFATGQATGHIVINPSPVQTVVVETNHGYAQRDRENIDSILAAQQ